MSPSSTGDSPHSGTGTVTASAANNPNGGGSRNSAFPLPTRDGFSIEIPSPQLNAQNGANNVLKSPSSVKANRAPSFSREGILGAAQKTRTMAQPSDGGRIDNGSQQVTSDDGMNPLKRRNTDAGVDYPRRRATIAVRAKLSEIPHPPQREMRVNFWGSLVNANLLLLLFSSCVV